MATGKKFLNKKFGKVKAKSKEYILIVCEGEKTEPNYFKTFLKEGTNQRYDKGGAFVTVIGAGYNTVSLVKKAENKAKGEVFKGTDIYYNEVYVVFDKDSFPAQVFNQAINNCRNFSIGKHQVKMKAIWSNESFELWYLLHFDLLQANLSRNHYIESLNKKRQECGFDSYQKNDISIRYDFLLEHGNEQKAIERARKLHKKWDGQTNYADHNPCTLVYILVEKLLELQRNLN